MMAFTRRVLGSIRRGGIAESHISQMLKLKGKISQGTTAVITILTQPNSLLLQ